MSCAIGNIKGRKMQTYRNSFVSDGHGGSMVTHSWRKDLRQRLKWLYGNPDKQIANNAADVEAWKNLGKVSE